MSKADLGLRQSEWAAALASSTCKASPAIVSNAILYWNTVKIGGVVDRLRAEGEEVSDEELSHILLLPFKHVMPNGTYFVDARDARTEGYGAAENDGLER